MKDRLLAAIRSELRARFDRLTKAAREAHAAATDPGSKAESKYDTRSLEASYLAAGQAKQVEDLARDIEIFESATLPEIGIEDAIDAGALVEVDLNDEPQWFLLAPAAGGVTLDHEGREITLLTPASALYQKLLGLHTGDSLDDPPLFVSEVL
ncbi:transcription elongation factor GreAB [Luteolibacter marinus]|uniref:transcription elongation factor GreAB n=1 Tax=Luteolibacter marinus TaxID=2776705 RepID=UPI001867B90C|nr:transcription elongation factor GreAB [Luteolibacter marinus]